MNVCKYSIKKSNYKFQDSLIILGAFEMIHKGHYRLFEKAAELAKKHNLKISLMSFSNISDVYRKDKRELFSLDDRLYIYASLGIEQLILIDFTKEINQIGAKDFMLSLKNNYRCVKFIMGQDFSVGNNREWGSQEIVDFFQNDAYVVELEKENNQKISSTKIKQYFEIGEINLVNQLLAHKTRISYFFKNKIARVAKNQISIHSGIYAILIENDNLLYHALLHCDINQKISIQFLNKKFEIKDQKYSVIFESLIRIIISSAFDSISKNDTKMAINYFLNL